MMAYSQIQRTPYEAIYYNAGLVNLEQEVLYPEVGACRWCTSPVFSQYMYCKKCEVHRKILKAEYMPETIAVLTYAGYTDQSRQDFYQYKEPISYNGPGFQRINQMLWDSMMLHAGCFSQQVSGCRVDALAWVPSGQGREPHPLEALVRPLAGQRPLVQLRRLAPREEPRDKGIDPTRYSVDTSVQGAHILLVEDCWVSGTNSLSVAAALKRTGAKHVSILCLSRYFKPSGYLAHRKFLELTNHQGFDPNFCPVTRTFHPLTL